MEEYRAPAKKAARARVFRTIGKVRQSLQNLGSDSGGQVAQQGEGAAANGGEDGDTDTSSRDQVGGAVKKSKKGQQSGMPATDVGGGGDVSEDKRAGGSGGGGGGAVTKDKDTRRKMKQRLQLLNKQIAMHGQRKQLTKAQRVYEQIRGEGLTPSDYTHTNLINAFVRSGDIAGALRQLGAMQSAGARPNVVTYTALIKGLCSIGDMSGMVVVFVWVCVCVSLWVCERAYTCTWVLSCRGREICHSRRSRSAPHCAHTHMYT